MEQTEPASANPAIAGNCIDTSSSIIQQLEEFRHFLESHAETAIRSRTDERRARFRANGGAAAVTRNSSKTEVIKEIGKKFVLLSNDNILATQDELRTMLADSGSNVVFDEGVVRKLNTIIRNVVTSSNVSHNNAKDIYMICIAEIDKFQPGFLASFFAAQAAAPFNAEVLDCLMSVVALTHDYDEPLVAYMLRDPKAAFAACMKFVPQDPRRFETVYRAFVTAVNAAGPVSGYIRFVQNELNGYYGPRAVPDSMSEDSSVTSGDASSESLFG